MSSTYTAKKWLVALVLLAVRELEASGLRRQRRRCRMLALTSPDLGVSDWGDCPGAAQDEGVASSEPMQTKSCGAQSHSNYD